MSKAKCPCDDCRNKRRLEMSRSGGDKLEKYFIDVIKGRTKRAYSTYYVATLPNCSVLMSKKAGYEEAKELISYSCPKGTVHIFFCNTITSLESLAAKAAKNIVWHTSSIANRFNDNLLGMKLLDFNTIPSTMNNCSSDIVISMLFADAANNLVINLIETSDMLSPYNVNRKMEESRFVVRSNKYRVPKEIRTLAAAEKHYFNLVHKTTPDQCYKINGRFVVPATEEQIQDFVEDKSETIENPFYNINNASAKIIKRLRPYLLNVDLEYAAKILTDRVNYNSHPFKVDFNIYMANIKEANKHAVKATTLISLLLKSAVFKEGFPMLGYSRDSSGKEYIQGTFESNYPDLGELISLHKWYLVVPDAGL